MRCQKIGRVSEILRARACSIGIGRTIYPGLCYETLYVLKIFSNFLGKHL